MMKACSKVTVLEVGVTVTSAHSPNIATCISTSTAL